jgi:hypothetical protein
MNLSYCSIDSEKRFIGTVEDLNFIRTASSDNLIHTLPPTIQENQEAFWNGSGWSIRKIKASSIKTTPVVIHEKEIKIQDHDVNASCIKFFENQMSILNLEIFKKIEKNKKVPKSWNEYKNILNENIELCKTKIIDEIAFIKLDKKKTVLEIAFEHYQNTNYDTNDQIVIHNGYDLDFLKKSLSEKNYKKWHDFEYSNLPSGIDFSKNIFVLASQEIDDRLSLFWTVNEILEDVESDDEDENSKTKKVKSSHIPSENKELILEVSKDFVGSNAERYYVIDKNNIQKFIDDYGDRFKKYERDFSIPSMIDFLEDKYIYSKGLSYNQWVSQLLISPKSLFVVQDNQYSEKKVTKEYNMNLYFKNIQNVHELIQSESSKKYSNREKNPSKPIPRN